MGFKKLISSCQFSKKNSLESLIVPLCAGMDAQVSYAFHSERKLHPEKFKNQLVNQVPCS